MSSGPRTLAFAVALVAWGLFFYAIDVMIMEGQGLPVTATLMPAAE